MQRVPQPHHSAVKPPPFTTRSVENQPAWRQLQIAVQDQSQEAHLLNTVMLRQNTRMPIMKVKSHRLMSSDPSQFPKHYLIEVECIEHRLTEIGQVGLSEALYLITECLLGYQAMFYRFGSAKIDLSECGLNSNGQCRVGTVLQHHGTHHSPEIVVQSSNIISQVFQAIIPIVLPENRQQIRSIEQTIRSSHKLTCSGANLLIRQIVYKQGFDLPLCLVMSNCQVMSMRSSRVPIESQLAKRSCILNLNSESKILSMPSIKNSIISDKNNVPVLHSREAVRERKHNEFSPGFSMTGERNNNESSPSVSMTSKNRNGFSPGVSITSKNYNGFSPDLSIPTYRDHPQSRPGLSMPTYRDHSNSRPGLSTSTQRHHNQLSPAPNMSKKVGVQFTSPPYIHKNKPNQTRSRNPKPQITWSYCSMKSSQSDNSLLNPSNLQPNKSYRQFNKVSYSHEKYPKKRCYQKSFYINQPKIQSIINIQINNSQFQNSELMPQQQTLKPKSSTIKSNNTKSTTNYDSFITDTKKSQLMPKNVQTVQNVQNTERLGCKANSEYPFLDMCSRLNRSNNSKSIIFDQQSMQTNPHGTQLGRGMQANQYWRPTNSFLASRNNSPMITQNNSLRSSQFGLTETQCNEGKLMIRIPQSSENSIFPAATPQFQNQLYRQELKSQVIPSFQSMGWLAPMKLISDNENSEDLKQSVYCGGQSIYLMPNGLQLDAMKLSKLGTMGRLINRSVIPDHE